MQTPAEDAFRKSPKSDAPPAVRDDEGAFWRSLVHRWFVRYNPIYLVSAMLVLVGSNLVSRGLAQEGSIYGPLGVAVVAELYAAALLGGAALLYRTGKRRPAVLMVLLAVVYQGDLTLHTEMCGVLGRTGVAPTAAWLAAFVAKLFLLAKVVRIRLSSRAIATATVGATGLAVLPYVLPQVSAETAGSLVAGLVVVLGGLAPERLETSVVPEDTLDDWGRVVLRRAVRATFAIWALLLALHVLFWASETPIALGRVVPAFGAIVLARQRREARVWVVAAASVALAAIVVPREVSFVAALAASAFVVRTFSRVKVREAAIAAAPRSPYRAPITESDDTPVVVTIEDVYEPVAFAERVRLASGALAMAHLTVWTLAWRGGPLPPHLLWLDVVAALFAVALAVRFGARLVLAHVVAIGGHTAFVAGIVPIPRSFVAWGAVALALGFVSLFSSIALSHRARNEETSPS